MKFILEIDCGNAAFALDCDDVVNAECQTEVARILRWTAHNLANGYGDHFPLADANGNRVGTARFEVTP